MPSLIPVFRFTIPSMTDATPLDCRIYHPSSNLDSDADQQCRKKGAIVAHPYAPMGGCFDDPVVMTVAELLLAEGFVVVTFNFRGASPSKGSTSWSGKPERDDYASIIGFTIYYLSASSSSSGYGPPLSHTSSPITLLLSGYSYGSLILSQLSFTSSILSRFQSSIVNSNASEIQHRAHALAEQYRSTEVREIDNRLSPQRNRRDRPHSPRPVVYGGRETPRASREEKRRSSDIIRKSLDTPRRIRGAVTRNRGSSRTVPSTPSPSASPEKDIREHGDPPPRIPSSTDGDTLPTVRTYYLLISPLLPPVSYFLCPSLSSIFSFGRPSSHIPASTIGNNTTLAVFGSADVFVSARKLRSWARSMQEASIERGGEDRGRKAGFEWHEIEGAGHFWREEGVERVLKGTIRDWVQGVVLSQPT